MATVFRDESAALLVSRARVAAEDALAAVDAAEAAFRTAWNVNAARRAAEVPSSMNALIDAVERAAMVAAGGPWERQVRRSEAAVAAAHETARRTADLVGDVVAGKHAIHTAPYRYLLTLTTQHFAERVDLTKRQFAATSRQTLAARKEIQRLALCVPGRTCGGVAARLLRGGALLLPRTSRARWLEEWSGELASLGRWERAGFTWHMLRGMPLLAATLRTSSGKGRNFTGDIP